MSVSATGPLLVAVETTGELCGIAVARGAQLQSEHTFRHAMHLSERIMGYLDRALLDEGVRAGDVDVWAADIGPGSFTGVRIGVMTVKTLAWTFGRPVVGVPSLEALALEYSGLPDVLVVPMLPCRSGVVFTGAYRVAGDALEEVLPPSALTLPDLAAALRPMPETRLLLCAAAAHAHQELLARLLAETGKTVACGPAAHRPGAAQIARLAAIRLSARPFGENPLALNPLYVAPPPITLPRKPIPGALAE